uniref:Uncharacterized protein n=1 Tax=Euplotes crassus TaxID=5936 RepID=A0A7S3NN02_EUPCR|mmetsp:Transcript_14918/g.14787  ORF Transcript_14918/g.14787 Transcript_14918/m.14787 type:complete len:159 (+) Transcript_14918:684-1160(+)
MSLLEWNNEWYQGLMKAMRMAGICSWVKQENQPTESKSGGIIKKRLYKTKRIKKKKIKKLINKRKRRRMQRQYNPPVDEKSEGPEINDEGISKETFDKYFQISSFRNQNKEPKVDLPRRKERENKKIKFRDLKNEPKMNIIDGPNTSSRFLNPVVWEE